MELLAPLSSREHSRRRQRRRARSENKHTGQEANVTAKRDFYIRVKAAGQRHAAAGNRETSDEQHHRDRTTNECEWRGGSQSSRNCRWNHENSRTDCRANNIRGQSWNSDPADELMIDALGPLNRRRRFTSHCCMLRDSVALSKSAGYGQRPKGRLFEWQGIMVLHVRRDACF